MRVGKTGVAVYVAVVWAGMACAAAADSPYRKRDDWASTMLASREALLQSRDASSFSPVHTDVLRGGQPPVQVSADISGLKTLCLIANVGEDDYSYDQAIWGDPALVAADGTRTLLSTLEPESSKVGWGKLEKDKNHAGRPLEVAGRVFEHGFWAHAPSRLCFALDGTFVRFDAWVGIDAGAGTNGSAGFEVSAGADPVSVVWSAIEKDFPQEARWFEEDAGPRRIASWFDSTRTGIWERRVVERVLESLGASGHALREERLALQTAHGGHSAVMLDLYCRAAAERDRIRRVASQLQRLNLAALERAILDLMDSFPDRYPRGTEFLERVEALAPRIEAIYAGAALGDPAALAEAEAALVLERDALLANPLLDFDELLVVRRSDSTPVLGLPQNWQGNCSLPPGDYENEIAALRWRENDAAAWRTLYRPAAARFAGDVDLNFDADRLLFSMPDDRGKYQIWEIGIDGNGLRQVTPGEEPDVDNYDACYLPDGRIIYGSSACYHGIPCVFGGDAVANLCIMNADGSGVRQLCVDQDHDWCPTLLNNGRVMYLRWEYSDLPHSNSRILFHMNPDGTAQMEYCASNSYWPNGVFFARPIPGHPTQFAGIVTGHHGVRRMGELVLFDPAKGRLEAEGVAQRIPGWNKPVEPIKKDRLVDDSWPKFLHPYPLSGKYFLTACQPKSEARWGLYLVDVFDNLLLLREEPGEVLFEPIPLRRTRRPPVIPDRVDTQRKDAVVYLADIYRGAGLAGIPKGVVKKLRVFSYTFSYRGMGGLLGTIGMDGPWDIKNVLGTVPVEEDGSALFRVPANTPIAVQPLDAKGKALQVMRSWFTAMPGETLSCVGCHEKQNMSPPPQATVAARRAASDIEPWYGPPRGFSFAREVQPVLDRRCLACHDGEIPPDLRGDVMIDDWNSAISGHASPEVGGKFSLAYAELHRFVRRPGIESDFYLLSPMEYHADTTELVQIIERGHYGVELNEEEWGRLVTWIDLNAPYHGAWSEILGKDRVEPVAARRAELRQKYLGIDEDAEALPPLPAKAAFEPPRQSAERAAGPQLPGWPWPAEEAHLRQAVLGTATRGIDAGDGVHINLVFVPAGEFQMGDSAGGADEQPVSPVRVDAPYWMSALEITNAQFNAFDPSHDSRVESKHGYQFGVHGYPLNEPEQPVVRVSWEQAMAFCDWLSDRTGERFSLPTEAQWEYACRAGSGTPFAFGTLDSDFSAHANLGDLELERFASNPYLVDAPLPAPNKYDDWIPHDSRFRDNGFLSIAAGNYLPNAWGLHDMHGNVWEWTRSAYRPYPYIDNDGRNAPGPHEKRVARGGSWYDRPKRCTASARLAYVPWQRVFNVGFRVVSVPPETVASHKINEGVLK